MAVTEPGKVEVEHVDWCDHEHDSGPCRGEWAGPTSEEGHLLLRMIDQEPPLPYYEVSMAKYDQEGTGQTEVILEFTPKQMENFLNATGMDFCRHVQRS